MALKVKAQNPGILGFSYVRSCASGYASLYRTGDTRPVVKQEYTSARCEVCGSTIASEHTE